MKSGWPMKKLGQLCNISMGFTPARANSKYWGPGYNWLSIADMSQGKDITKTKETITNEAIIDRQRKIVEPGTLLMSFKLSVGKLAFARVPTYTNEAIVALPVINKNELFPDFLYYALQSIDLNKGTDRAAMGNTLNKAKLEEIEIPCPPIDEQHRIAAILDKADVIRSKRQESIHLTESFLRSIFLDMFGDPVTNPKEWHVEPLANLVNFTTGKLDSNAAVKGGAYPFFTCSREDFQIDSFAFDCEALLLAGNNASADYSVKHYKGKFNAYQRTYVITMARSDLSFRYMKYALEMKLQEMKKMSKGTNTKYLTLGILNRLLIQVPEKNVQIKFESICDNVVNYTEKLTDALALSNIAYDSLVYRAFRGEL